MAQYVSWLIPNYATITTPLCLLTRQDTPWNGSKKNKEHWMSWKKPLLEIKLCLILIQERRPQSLSMPVHLVLVVFWYKRVKFLFMQVVLWVMLKAATPKWRETLAVVWEVEHFLPHVYGAKFSVITGHKSVIGIFKNHKQTSLQIERWKLWLMPYDCQLIYWPGRDVENPTDFMSQHPSSTAPEEPNLAGV